MTRTLAVLLAATTAMLVIFALREREPRARAQRAARGSAAPSRSPPSTTCED